MNPEFAKQFDSLIEKMAELVTGDTSPEMLEKVKIWAVYNHAHKALPHLTGHWAQQYPEGKADIRAIFEEIRSANQALQAARSERQE